jgi:hypothetical protein
MTRMDVIILADTLPDMYDKQLWIIHVGTKTLGRARLRGFCLLAY